MNSVNNILERTTSIRHRPCLVLNLFILEYFGATVQFLWSLHEFIVIVVGYCGIICPRRRSLAHSAAPEPMASVGGSVGLGFPLNRLKLSHGCVNYSRNFRQTEATGQIMTSTCIYIYIFKNHIFICIRACIYIYMYIYIHTYIW